MPGEQKQEHQNRAGSFVTRLNAMQTCNQGRLQAVVEPPLVSAPKAPGAVDESRIRWRRKPKKSPVVASLSAWNPRRRKGTAAAEVAEEKARAELEKAALDHECRKAQAAQDHL